MRVFLVDKYMAFPPQVHVPCVPPVPTPILKATDFNGNTQTYSHTDTQLIILIRTCALYNSTFDHKNSGQVRCVFNGLVLMGSTHPLNFCFDCLMNGQADGGCQPLPMELRKVGISWRQNINTEKPNRHRNIFKTMPNTKLTRQTKSDTDPWLMHIKALYINSTDGPVCLAVCRKCH